MSSSEIVKVSEFEELAKQKLPKMVYDYYSTGAEDLWTLKQNRSAFERIRGWLTRMVTAPIFRCSHAFFLYTDMRFRIEAYSSEILVLCKRIGHNPGRLKSRHNYGTFLFGDQLHGGGELSRSQHSLLSAPRKQGQERRGPSGAPG